MNVKNFLWERENRDTTMKISKKKRCNQTQYTIDGKTPMCNVYDGFFDGDTGEWHHSYEMPYPFCTQPDLCNGNIHSCHKRQLHWLASLSEDERKKQIEYKNKYMHFKK